MTRTGAVRNAHTGVAAMHIMNYRGIITELLHKSGIKI
jgi:hypothetical protein